jgi:hypothetical protein
MAAPLLHIHWPQRYQGFVAQMLPGHGWESLRVMALEHQTVYPAPEKVTLLLNAHS